MYPLIEIKSVPIEIQIKRTNATLEYSRGTADMEISRSDKGVDIKSRPIKVQLDTFEPRSPGRNPSAEIQVAKEAGYEATAAVSESGDLMVNARLENMSQANQSVAAQVDAQNQALAESEFPMEVSPLSGVAVERTDNGSMEIRYQMDKLNFDWKIDKGEFKFTPGDIEITVAQHPSVTIKYLGGPLYVPPSSDPNYEPVDVKA